MADEYVTHDEMDTGSQRDATAVALVYITTLILLVGIFLVQKSLADKFGAGMFGSGTPAAR
jgi:hypothetical protein